MGEPAQKIGHMAKGKILVVDDEESIRHTLEGVLADEGFDVVLVPDGESALIELKKSSPSLVLLDIWMPGMDGMETLIKLREICPNLPIIMMSGHATIATAVAATKLGAQDFLEKPIDLKLLNHAISKALAGACESKIRGQEDKIDLEDQNDFSSVETSAIDRRVFFNQTLPGRNIKQKTLARSAILYGQGLHSGKKSGLILEPLPPGSGIHFVGVSSPRPVPACIDFVESTGFATTLRLGRTQAGTIEHLMSALHAYGISNLLVKCNGEVPVMDGSAIEFCNLIEETGIEDQAGDWFEIAIKEKITVGNEKEWISLEPAEEFVVDYTLDYPEPVGTHHFQFTLTDSESYKNEIAPARTFGFVKDVGMLQKMGLALGGRFDNFVLLGEKGPINTALRFPNEMVRHKVLDAIGDLYLLGRRIRGKVTARMTGHSDNIALLKLLKAAM